MKILVLLVCAYAMVHAIQQNLTKRCVNDQLGYYPDLGPVRHIQAPITNSQPAVLYASASNPSEYTRPVTVQQLLYNEAPDHVHAPTNQYLNQPHASPPIQQPHAAIATPVQHGAVVHHGQGYSKFTYPYPAPAQLTPSASLPSPNPQIYTYTNGKILYPQPQRPNLYPQQPAPVVTQKPFKPFPVIAPTYYPQSKPVIRPKQDDDDRRRKSNNRDEDDEREQESYEEDEDEYRPSSRYSDDDDDDEDGHYRVQEDDEERYSKTARKPRNKKYTNYKPKMHLMNFKYSPMKDVFERRQSENIPIIHKHSFHQEKWIVTKKDN